MDNVSLNLQNNKGFFGIIKYAFSRKKADDGVLELREQQYLLEELRAAKQELENIQRFFNYTSDPDLIEYAIYQEYAVKLKYSYLVKKAKERKMTSVNFMAV